jgi:hypothetical protein
VKPKNSFALFCALWAFGLIAAYSLIPYKTPWLVLNFVVPLGADCRLRDPGDLRNGPRGQFRIGRDGLVGGVGGDVSDRSI